jgi:PDZ domain-containing protein
VGQIGGVEYKVMAAHEAGAQYFFCPKDRFPEDENEKLAKQTAKEIGTSMKIVPVSSLKEAVEFLRKLPPNPMST